MNKLTLLFLAGIAFSCNNADSTSKEAMTDPATTAAMPATAMHYPYTIDKPDNWETGSNANTMVVLSCLKAWEEGKLDESARYFADSVTVKFDGVDKKMSNAGVKEFLGAGRNSFKTVREKMDDWQSSVSKDKSQEWVTIWYTQTWETTDGVKDSSAMLNDLQLKDGKIIRIDEYTRKLH